MPQGKGTYGKKVGRPKKKVTAKGKKGKPARKKVDKKSTLPKVVNTAWMPNPKYKKVK
jgi:hypothetical protein